MNAFFYPLKRGFYFAEIQGGKVTAYNRNNPRRFKRIGASESPSENGRRPSSEQSERVYEVN